MRVKKQFPLCSFAFIVQFLPHQLSQYPLWFTLNKIHHQVSALNGTVFFFFLKEKYHPYQTLDTNICLPISPEKCPLRVAGNPAMASLCAQHTLTYPSCQAAHSTGVRTWLCTQWPSFECQFCHLPAVWPGDILLNLSLSQFLHL